MSAPADPQAVQALWHAASDRLRAWFARRTGSEHDADDLVQETFVRVHEKLATLRSAERADAWVGRVAAHVLADHHRARARRSRALDDADPATVAAAAPNEDADLCAAAATWLEAFLGQLAPDDAALLRAVDLEGRAQVDVARELGLSPSGARSRVQRARAQLRRHLEDCCTFAFDTRGHLTAATRRRDTPCGCDP